MSNQTWRKSSYSGENGTCVELIGTLDQVRDSKNPAGPSLRADITSLITAVRHGQFNR